MSVRGPGVIVEIRQDDICVTGMVTLVGEAGGGIGKDADTARLDEDAGVAEYLDFMRRNMPGTEPTNLYPEYGVTVAAALVVVLKQCGHALTRENIMRQPDNLHGVQLPLLRPRITLHTSPDDYAPIKEAYLMRFDGEVWRQAGGLLK